MALKESRVTFEIDGELYSVPKSKAKEFMANLEKSNKSQKNRGKDMLKELEEIGDMYDE